jgi:hypothetical protein
MDGRVPVTSTRYNINEKGLKVGEMIHTLQMHYKCEFLSICLGVVHLL